MAKIVFKRRWRDNEHSKISVNRADAGRNSWEEQTEPLNLGSINNPKNEDVVSIKIDIPAEVIEDGRTILSILKKWFR